MFSSIAHDLGKQGIATLRFNERFYQHPELLATNNTIYTESIDDVCTAVDMMLADERVSADNIFLAGQSLGGMLAPIVAELKPEVKGIISLAGTPRKLVDVLEDQMRMTCDESNETLLTHEYADKILNDIRNITTPSDEMGGVEYRDDMTDEEKEELETYISWRIYSDTYWLSCHNVNMEEIINKLDIPMLILQGESDVNVLAAKDYVEWQRLLEGRNNCHFKLYPGLNHQFKVQKYPGFINNIKDYSEPGRMESYVTDDMIEFIHTYTEK